MNTPLSLHAPRTAFVDRLRTEQASVAVQVLGVVGFALLTALGAQIKVYVWAIPFTLQSLAVYGSGLYLGARNGFLAQLLYLVLGLFFPVYTGDGFGLSYFYTALSAGYLLAFPFAAAAVGYLSERWNTFPGSILSLAGGSLVLFAGGVVWLHFAAGHTSWAASLMQGWIVFIPIDLAKLLFVGLLYSSTRRFGKGGMGERGNG